jgi:hypothetical protein
MCVLIGICYVYLHILILILSIKLSMCTIKACKDIMGIYMYRQLLLITYSHICDSVVTCKYI